MGSSSKTASAPTNVDKAAESNSEEVTENEVQKAVETGDEELNFEEKSNRERPSQKASEKYIVELEKKLNTLYAVKDSMPSNEIEKQISKLREELNKERQFLKRKQKNAEYQKKHRDNKRTKLEEICNDNPEIKEKLCLRDSVGHPSLNQEQPLLLKTIADIAIFGSAADSKRRTESIRSVKTLDELTAELKKTGFTISRSGTYLRLLPRNSTSIEGRRHVSTVPVKLSRAQADHHRRHIDSQFATTSIRYLESIASILGPAQVFFLSQDDKARVPIGLTAANKQAPMLMHMEYRVSLPDHDWVVAERHKLIPSVYAGIEISPMSSGQPQAVGYSGPTFVSVRSGKHSSSTASTHAEDFETLLTLSAFQSLTKTEEGFVKPVVVFTVDGGPDENPRYQKVISFAVRHFKRHNLDALFICTNAPGRSSYNRVERRMAPLSRELAGLILPHDHYGSHLDECCHTIDVAMEKSNFEYAGKTLAEVWSSVDIDGYPVKAIYAEPSEPEEPAQPESKWYYNHVRESQYLLQIVKCRSIACCSPSRSGIFKILPDRFLPPPIKVKQTSNDLVISDEGEFLTLNLRLALKIDVDAKGFLQVPYDLFCPSVKSELYDRTCKECGLYHSSKKSANRHIKDIHSNYSKQTIQPRVRPVRVAARRANELLCIIQYMQGIEDAEWLNEEEVDGLGKESHTSSETADSGPIINEIQSWLKQPWSSAE